MAKKEYENLKLKLVVNDDNDIVTTSGPMNNENGFNLGEDKDFWS